MVKPQVADIIDLILQLIGHPNSVHRPCRNRKSRGAVLSTSEGQWATTKFDGVWIIEVELTAEEQAALKRSAEAVEELVRALPVLDVVGSTP